MYISTLNTIPQGILLISKTNDKKIQFINDSFLEKLKISQDNVNIDEHLETFKLKNKLKSNQYRPDPIIVGDPSFKINKS